MVWGRGAALPRGHRLYTSPETLKRSPWHADNDNIDTRKLTWEEFAVIVADKAAMDAAIAAGEPIPAPKERRRRVVKEEPTDWQVWVGAKYAPANDNRADRRWLGEQNYGPDADYVARKANPGASRDYEGDIFSRLVSEAVDDEKIKDKEALEAALVLRSVNALLSPAGMTAANDNSIDGADNEMPDGGFGLDYSMDQDEAEDIIEAYLKSGRLPDGKFDFRQRSGCGGRKLMAKHRREEWRGPLRYLALRGVAELPNQDYRSDGMTPWWRSHAPKNADAAKELAATCERTDWHRVTWIRYAPMPARVYGALGIYSDMKGVGEGKTTAPAHDVIHELYRSEAEKEFRKRMSIRNMRIIDAAIERRGYTTIAEVEGLSRNGAKAAVKAALKEAWSIISDITGEKMPEPEEKLSA